MAQDKVCGLSSSGKNGSSKLGNRRFNFRFGNEFGRSIYTSRRAMAIGLTTLHVCLSGAIKQVLTDARGAG